MALSIDRFASSLLALRPQHGKHAAERHAGRAEAHVAAGPAAVVSLSQRSLEAAGLLGRIAPGNRQGLAGATPRLHHATNGAANAGDASGVAAREHHANAEAAHSNEARPAKESAPANRSSSHYGHAERAAESHGKSGSRIGTVVSGAEEVFVDIEHSESGYENQIYWSDDGFKTKHLIGTDDETKTVSLGRFAPGTKIEFGIDNGQGDFFRTGAASKNADNLRHATVERTDSGTRIGFEDLHGGGDMDFNDAVITVRRAPVQSDEATAAAEAEGPAQETAAVENGDSAVENGEPSEGESLDAAHAEPDAAGADFDYFGGFAAGDEFGATVPFEDLLDNVEPWAPAAE